MKELTAEESKSIKEWCAKEKTVTLTNGEWSKLTTYLLLSKNHREGEAKAWAELAEEREEDGSKRRRSVTEKHIQHVLYTYQTQQEG